MSTPAAAVGGPAPRAHALTAWLCFGLLTLPFHPLWVDFEQVRRGVLLLFAGAVLLLQPALRPARGANMLLVFVGALAACGAIQMLAQWWFADAATPWSFQLWEAGYRLAHWLALWTLLRLGASSPPTAPALPLATLLLATSLFGLLQRLGIAELGGYGVEREPVSTFGNLNVASEWTAVAIAVVAALWPRERGPALRLSIAALLVAGAYLVVDRSRSGMVATPLGLGLLWLLRRQARGYVPLALTLAGAVLGLALDALPRPAPADARTQQAELQRATVTLDVRREIAKGATELFLQSPVFGHGPGQFDVLYPRVRSQREIELSSFERKFATEVRGAHDDWLELLVDGGLPVLLVFAAFLFAVQRRVPDKTRLVPMFVLLLLMLVRAPLFNAPAAAVAFWLAGAPIDGPPPRRWLLPLRRLAGLALAVLGVLPIVGNTLLVPYVAAQRDGTQPPVAAVTAAAAWMPFEPRWLELEAQENLIAGNLQRAAYLAAKACRLRPFAPQYLLLLGEVLGKGSRYGEALAVAKQGLALDPANPELRVLASSAYAEIGDVDRAIEAVVVEPHRRLRTQLERHFDALARLAAGRGAEQDAARFRAEQHFLLVLDKLGGSDVGAKDAAQQLWQELGKDLKDCGRLRTDLRWLTVGALQALDLGQAALATTFGQEAQHIDAKLTDWQRALFGAQLDRLQKLPAWQAPLARR